MTKKLIHYECERTPREVLFVFGGEYKKVCVSYNRITRSDTLTLISPIPIDICLSVGLETSYTKFGTLFSSIELNLDEFSEFVDTLVKFKNELIEKATNLLEIEKQKKELRNKGVD